MVIRAQSDDLLPDVEEARRLGECGRRGVREAFGADRMAREVELVLERTVATRRREQA